MTKKYQEVPTNFNVLKPYIIYEKNEVINEFYNRRHYFFYDTCSFLHHSNTLDRSYIIQYLKNEDAIIIITRTVLMELTANSFNLHPTQLRYLKELYNAELKILLLDEEIVADCIKNISNISNKEANILLGHAIKEVSKYKTITNKLKNNMDSTLKNKIIINPANTLMFNLFFRYARSQKVQGDSLAEELIFICIIVLTKIPLDKYILISDDLSIRNSVIRVNAYLDKHHKVKSPIQITTPALIYKMYKKSIITSKQDMINILDHVTNERITVYYLGEYDIKIENHSFDKEDLINRLISEEEFKIIY